MNCKYLIASKVILIVTISIVISVSQISGFDDKREFPISWFSTNDISTNYAGPINKISATNLFADESPELSPDSSDDNWSSMEKSDFAKNLGVEVTSVKPMFDDDVVSSPKPIIPFAAFLGSSNSGKIQKNAKFVDFPKIEQQKEVTKNTLKSNPPIQAAVQNPKRTIEYRPVVLEDFLADIEPRIIEIDGSTVPLEIHFKSTSSRLKLVSSHNSISEEQVERTESEDEPQRLVHTVHKPIIQEVREIITPQRRIVQEIQPVVEEIHTVVAQYGKNRSRTSSSGKQTINPILSPLKKLIENQKNAQSTLESTEKVSQNQTEQQSEQKPVEPEQQISSSSASSSQFSTSNLLSSYGPSVVTYSTEDSSAASPQPESIKDNPQQLQQTKEEDSNVLETAASNTHWQSIRPYAFIGPQNNQFQGPSWYQQQFYSNDFY